MTAFVFATKPPIPPKPFELHQDTKPATEIYDLTSISKKRINSEHYKVGRVMFARFFIVDSFGLDMAMGEAEYDADGKVLDRQRKNWFSQWKVEAWGEDSFAFKLVEHEATTHDFDASLTNHNIRLSNANDRQHEARDDDTQAIHEAAAATLRQHGEQQLANLRQKCRNWIEADEEDIKIHEKKAKPADKPHADGLRRGLPRSLQLQERYAALVIDDGVEMNLRERPYYNLAAKPREARDLFWEKVFDKHYEAIARSILRPAKNVVAVENMIQGAKFRHVLEHTFMNMAEFYCQRVVFPKLAMAEFGSLLPLVVSWKPMYSMVEVLGQSYWPEIGLDIVLLPDVKRVSKRKRELPRH